MKNEKIILEYQECQKSEKSEELVDIRYVNVNTDLPEYERIKDYIAQIKNPCKFLYGDITVSVNFSDDGISFEDIIADFIRTFNSD